jgi:hypothetical protein
MGSVLYDSMSSEEVERRVLAHPLHPLLTTMPGFRVRTTAAARLLINVAIRAFASSGNLAAYAELAPLQLVHPR